MKKTMRKITACLIATLTLFATACGDESSSEEIKWSGHGEVNLWTMPSSANPIQEADCSAYYTASPKLEIELAKNESEAGQIFFHTTGGVRSYTLESCDLVDDAGNKIEKENIKIYNEYYTHVEQLSIVTSGRPYGHYPDALIPQRLSEKVGENTVPADFNQGIYVDVFADKDTPAGVYKGDFKLKIDGDSFTVPVSVRVRDFTLTDENHVQSAFDLFPEYIMGGDLNNTPENYKKYVDYLLDYRVSTTDPVYEKMTDEELWLEQMKEYAANPKVSSYDISVHFGLEKELRMLIENSTPELNLVEKAFRYLADEPPATELATYETRYKNCVDQIIAISQSYTDEELASYGLTHADIEGIEVLITLTISDIGKIDGLRTYCGLVSDFSTETRREKYEEAKANPYLGANNELAGTDYGSTWWYVCCFPYEPNPNYHIDNDVLDARVLSWMQYDYDIDGMLYWGTASYFDTSTMQDDLGGWKSVDPYDDAEAVFTGKATQGDGFLLYPGAKYGQSGPLPSTRLINIRDGFEDYEYLYALEEMMEEYLDQYDISEMTNFDKVMSPIYDTLYTENKASNDYTRVIDARSEVLDMLEWLSSDSHAIVQTNEPDILKNEVTVDVYATAGSTLTVDGKEIMGSASGTGVKFSYAQKLEGLRNAFKATLKTGDKTVQIRKPLGSSVKVVSDCNDDTKFAIFKKALRGGNEYIEITRNTDPAYIKNGTGSMRVQVDNGNWTDYEVVKFVSGLTVSSNDFFGVDTLPTIDYIMIDIYSASETEFELTFRMETKKGSSVRSKAFYSATVKQGWNSIKIPYINNMTWQSGDEDLLAYLSGVILEFEKIEEDIDIYIDSIYYAYIA